MKQYLDILNEILTSHYTVHKKTRTGIDTLSLSGVQFVHDLREGFPLLTTKKMGIKSISAELEFFIKGLSDKKWLQERGCTIWDEWANPEKINKKVSDYINQKSNSGNTPSSVELDATKKGYQKLEPDLGRIYGVQWRDWKTHEKELIGEVIGGIGVNTGYENVGFDQLKNVIDRAKKDPLDRRLIVSAWRPDEIDQMALPPCHYAWQILSDGKYLDLIWIQRSCDFGIGIPYNIASYAILLLLLSKELNLIPRRLVGQLGDTHIYENHFDGLKIQASRDPYPLPTVIIPDENWNGILEWKYTDIILENYKYHPKINLPIAI